MNYLVLLILLILFYFVFKVLFVYAHQALTQRYFLKNSKEVLIFLISPLLLKKHSSDKYFSLYYYLSFILSQVWATILALKFQQIQDLLNINFSVTLLYVLSMVITVLFLLYLSIFDVMSFSIPEVVSRRLVMFAIFVNLIFLILKILMSNSPSVYIFGLVNLGGISNLLGGLIGAGIIWLIVKLSNEKAMGAGDIDILAAIGLLVGFPGIFYSFFYTLISASVISIIYVALKKKYKGVLIPFVPFLASGFILALVLSDTVVRIFTLY